MRKVWRWVNDNDSVLITSITIINRGDVIMLVMRITAAVVGWEMVMIVSDVAPKTSLPSPRSPYHQLEQ